MVIDKAILKKFLEVKDLESETATNLILTEILDPGDPFLNELAHQELDVALLKQTIAPRLFAKTADEAAGPILLGNSIEDPDKIVGLFPLDPTRTVLIVGTPGSGKTTLIRNFQSQIIEGNQGAIPPTNSISFDSKLDSVALYRLYPEILVIPWQSLCFNPLQVPKGVDPKIWLGRFVDLFCGVFLIGDFGYQDLLEAVDRLYTDFGVYLGKPEFPTLFNLREELAKKNKSNSSWRQKEALSSLLNRLGGLSTTFGKGLDYNRAYCVPELTTGHIVITTNGLASQHAGFLISLIFAWAYSFNEGNSLRDDTLRVVFIIDEAEPVLGKGVREHLGRLPMLFQLLPRLREFGIGLIVATQTPRGLDDLSVIPFAQTKIIKTLVDNLDIDFIGKSVGLTKEQMAYCRGMKPEEAIVFISGRQSEPTLIQIPDYPLDKSVDWDELNRVMESRIKSHFHLQRPTAKPQPNPIPQSTSPTPKQTATPKQTSKPSSAPPIPKPKPAAPSASTPGSTVPTGATSSLDVDVKSCLVDIRSRPLIPKSQRLADLFGSSTSYQQKIADACLGDSYVTEHEIHPGGQSGVVKLWQITDKGLALIGLPPKPLPGKGDLLHQYLQSKVSEKVKEWGFKPHIEFFRCGKNVDVGIQSQNLLLAIEIATTAGNETTNLLKDIDAGFNQVVVLPINETVRKDIERTLKRQVSPTYLSKVLVLTIPKFLDAKTIPW